MWCPSKKASNSSPFYANLLPMLLYIVFIVFITKKRKHDDIVLLCLLRASLGTPFFQEISIFLWENELFSLGKMEIPWNNGVSKLALKGSIGWRWKMPIASEACNLVCDMKSLSRLLWLAHRSYMRRYLLIYSFVHRSLLRWVYFCLCLLGCVLYTRRLTGTGVELFLIVHPCLWSEVILTVGCSPRSHDII
jgi:hypothetical protein